MTLQAILAISDDGFIGTEDHRAIPWRLPPDLKRFKAITTGHAVIMGRRTFESIGRPLPNRRNVVVTRNADLVANTRATPGDVHFVRSPQRAVEVAYEIDGEPFVIGGAEIYRALWPRVDRVHVTQVHQYEVKGVKFDLDYDAFDAVKAEGIFEHDSVHYSFVTLQRKEKIHG